MYPGTHAATTPDKPAVVMAGTGETVTYAELEERSIRLARRAARRRPAPGRRRRAAHGERAAALRGVLGRPARGLYITAVNHHLSPTRWPTSSRDCGAKVLIVSAGAALAGRLAEATPEVEVRLAFGGAVEGYDDYERALAAVSAEPLADQPRGADMLYSSGTTGRAQGRPPRCRTRQVDEPGDLLVAVFGADLRLRRRHRLPVPRAALPRGAAALQRHRARDRRHRRGDGEVRPRGGAGRDREARRSPTASGCRRCSCGCSSCPRTSGRGTTCPR